MLMRIWKKLLKRLVRQEKKDSFLKPEKLEVNLNVEYAAMEIPNDFIVGYGLDYNQQGRNLREIYTLVEGV